jgi:uncharacterized protein YjcR
MALSDRQKQAIELLTSGGMKKIRVAEHLGVTPDTISRWFRDTEFNEEYRRANQAYIQSLSQIALETYTDLLANAQSESVKANIAKDLLSRGGYDATNKQEITQKQIVITIEEPNEDGTENKSEDIQ